LVKKGVLLAIGREGISSSAGNGKMGRGFSVEGGKVLWEKTQSVVAAGRFSAHGRE